MLRFDLKRGSIQPGVYLRQKIPQGFLELVQSPLDMNPSQPRLVRGSDQSWTEAGHVAIIVQDHNRTCRQVLYVVSEPVLDLQPPLMFVPMDSRTLAPEGTFVGIADQGATKTPKLQDLVHTLKSVTLAPSTGQHYLALAPLNDLVEARYGMRVNVVPKFMAVTGSLGIEPDMPVKAIEDPVNV